MIPDINTKVRIRDKAKELFLRYGIRSVSMDDIANQLGMSKKTIYQYFTDKNELVDAVIEDELQNLCTDDAVERVIGNGRAYRQIVDYRVCRFSTFDIDDFGARDPIAAELERVPVVIDLQHGSANTRLVSCKKLLDVVTVDRLPAMQPPCRAPRPHPAQDIEIRHPIHREEFQFEIAPPQS